ncbi:tryptophan halogenase family protein [Amycolatopsis samaneae]|uniref:Tryptophan halogenase family protein n=1 Tax=Amycolatopsis samaneae TaxID=664691 RepID=A0ABW5GP29_9PSEU
MDNRVANVVILGGGTAGWMAAAYLGKALGRTVRVWVLESPSVPRIGVGEASIPNLQSAFFDFLGIEEDRWMRECNAAFKTGIKFVNWRTPGAGEPGPRPMGAGTDHYYHTFGLLPESHGLPLSQYWFARKYTGETDVPFDYACLAEPPIMDAKKAPRFADGRPATRYAWHFDAAHVADFLRRFATAELDVEHIEDHMVEVLRDARGYVTALRTESGRLVEGDLFVDCSGFRGLLINEAMEEPFVHMNDHLLCDSAVATAVPHDDEADGIEPYTSAIAMKSGWTWKIPMLGRFGSGYVYSSRFADQDEAIRDFCALWDLDPETTPLSRIRFRVGRNRRAWVKNVVSIGLASCFLEPLESTGIYFAYAGVYQLVKFFPDKGFAPGLRDGFNAEIEAMFDDMRDFVQAHFCFAPRRDTPFWRANAELRLSDSIREKIALYEAGIAINPPVTDESTYYANIEAEFRNFWTNGSYYCVLAGLGHLPTRPLPLVAHRQQGIERAGELFADIRRRQAELLDTLPSNYEYLRSLHRAGEPVAP